MLVHIPGKMNVLAFQGSRLEPLATELMLDPEIDLAHSGGSVVSDGGCHLVF